MNIIHEDPPDATTVDAITQSLQDYNASILGTARQPLVLAIRGEDGILQAGLKAFTGWGWLYIYMLCVEVPHRGKGYGSALLRAAEDKGRSLGCTNAYLDTHSFQAPEFYYRHGYAEFGRLDDFPPGYTRLWLKKAL